MIITSMLFLFIAFAAQQDEPEQTQEGFPIDSAIVAAIVSGSIVIAFLIYKEKKLEPQKWKNNAKLQTIEKRLEAYGTLLNFLQSSKSRGNNFGKNSENKSHLLIIPQDRDKLLETFQKYRYLFSLKLIENFQNLIKNDKELYLASKTQEDDWYQLFDLSEMEQIAQTEFQNLQSEHQDLTGYSME